MEAQKIKIELEVTPQIAMLLSMYLSSTAQGDFTLQKMLTETGIKDFHDIAQSIMDQLSEKTDINHLRLRTNLSILSNPDDPDLNILRN